MTVPMTWATLSDVYQHIDKRDALDCMAEEADEAEALREARLTQLINGMKGRMIVSMRRRYLMPLRWPSTMDATIVAAEQEAIRDLQVELVIQLIWGRKGKETDEVKGNREEMNKRIKSLGDLSSDIVLSAAPSTGHFQVTKRPASDMVPDGLPYFTDDLVP